MERDLVPQRNCSWAHAFGRMRGFDQVYYGSVGDYDKMCMENWLDLYEGSIPRSPASCRDTCSDVLSEQNEHRA